MAKICMCGKVCYATRAAAQRGNPRHHWAELRLGVYGCPICEGWHLTSKRPRRRRPPDRRPQRDGRRAKARPPMSS
jgi:hypothetical protein